jgi:hypothetical protein
MTTTHHTTGKPIELQIPACDSCTQGVMDADNPHLYGDCGCRCHWHHQPSLYAADPEEA